MTKVVRIVIAGAIGLGAGLLAYVPTKERKKREKPVKTHEDVLGDAVAEAEEALLKIKEDGVAEKQKFDDVVKKVEEALEDVEQLKEVAASKESADKKEEA